MSNLTETEILQLQTAALAYVQANSTPTLIATVERIVADRERAQLEPFRALLAEWEAHPPIWRDPAVGPAVELRLALLRAGHEEADQ